MGLKDTIKEQEERRRLQDQIEDDINLPTRRRVIRGSELVDIVIEPGEPIKIIFHSAMTDPVVEVSTGSNEPFARVAYNSVLLRGDVGVVCDIGRVEVSVLTDSYKRILKLKEALKGML